MNINSIKSKTSEIISKQLRVETSEINGLTTLHNLGADLLDKVEIILSIEKKFKILMYTQPDKLYESNFDNLCNQIHQTILLKTAN